MKKINERAVDSILGTETKLKVEEEGLSKDFILHLFHKTGRDLDSFGEVVSEVLEEDSIQTINELIEKNKEVNDKLRKIKKGIIKDRIVKKILTDEEIEMD